MISGFGDFEHSSLFVNLRILPKDLQRLKPFRFFAFTQNDNLFYNQFSAEGIPSENKEHSMSNLNVAHSLLDIEKISSATDNVMSSLVSLIMDKKTREFSLV